MIELFDRELVETQEATGMRVIGQFEDLDRPDRFVWLRGFTDMVARERALAEFYDGPVWAAHRDAANATMIDSDDVLLLRPCAIESGFRLPATSTRGVRPTGDDRGAVLVVVHPRQAGREPESAEYLESTIQPALKDAGLRLLGSYETEPSANTFPRLPVRAGANVLVWFAASPSRAAVDTAWRLVCSTLSVSPGEATTIPPSDERPQVLRLVPTSRSLVDGNPGEAA